MGPQTERKGFTSPDNTRKIQRIGIIGGGLTGLAVAYALTHENTRVTIFEKDEIPGGLASSFDIDGIPIDKYYRHVFESHTELMKTLEKLGIKDRLFFKKTSMAYFSGGQLYPLDSPLDLLNFKPLSFLERLRLGFNLSLLLFHRDWKKLDGIGAGDYLIKHFGHRVFTQFWEPLLKNKFGDFSSKVSAAWLWDRVKSRSSRGGKKFAGSLGYLTGGFKVLIDRLMEEIIKHGGEIITNCEITKIGVSRGRLAPFTLFKQDTRFTDFDECIVTLPVPCFLDIAPTLPEEYINGLKGIDYAHSICMVLQLDRPVSPYYWVNIGDRAFPLSVTVEHTRLADPSQYNGNHILYVSQYVASETDYTWNTPDHALFDMYCRFLKKIFPTFSETNVRDYRVFREKYTQPVFTAGYSGVKPGFFTPVPGLSLVDTSQFYPLSRCMNTSFILANEFIRQWKEKERKTR